MNHAHIRSKVPLTSSEIEAIVAKLGATSHSEKIDHSLTGGFIVEYNWRLYDFTIGVTETNKIKSFGIVTRYTDGIALAEGLPDCGTFEIVETADGHQAVIMSLGEFASAVCLDASVLAPGTRLYATGTTLSVPVTKNLLGRVVSPVGIPLDGKGDLDASTYYPIERPAPGIIERTPVSQPLETGILAIDALIPVGRGQRELIIGDRKTGKTLLALSTILNQKGKNMICVYVSIAQKQSNIAKTVALLAEHGALEYTIVVASSASENALLNYISPFSGTAIAEYFLHKGRDVLIVYDDLTKHAWAYRELSLLLGRPSGREAYPGDIFYAHARLLERACKLGEKSGGGSISAFPIIETQSGDVSTYVPTNVISITDGQLFLDANQFNAGRRPAVSVGNSVSRVGSNAQTKSMKQVSGKLRLELAQFRELESFTQFGAEVDEVTQEKINRGKVLTQLLKQKPYEAISTPYAVALIWAAIHGYFDFPAERTLEARSFFFEQLSHEHRLLSDIDKKEGLTEAVITNLTEFCVSFKSEYEQASS